MCRSRARLVGGWHLFPCWSLGGLQAECIQQYSAGYKFPRSKVGCVNSGDIHPRGYFYLCSVFFFELHVLVLILQCNDGVALTCWFFSGKPFLALPFSLSRTPLTFNIEGCCMHFRDYYQACILEMQYSPSIFQGGCTCHGAPVGTHSIPWCGVHRVCNLPVQLGCTLSALLVVVCMAAYLSSSP
jgi:hypothetical protein